MKKFLCVLALSVVSWVSVPAAPASAQTNPINALILYDAPAGVQYQNMGLSYAIMLRNLLGHFKYKTVTLESVAQYTAGQIANNDVTFYIGSYYGNTIPTAFLNDVNATTKTVVWFKYNIWQYAWSASYNFSTKYGYSFVSLAGMNSPPSASNPAPGFYDTITYKGLPMVKYYAYNSSTGAISADPDVGVTSIPTGSAAQQLVTITNSVTGATAPYVVRSGNFWYFADIPLSYIGPRDRYLVLCDLLHDIVNSGVAENHRALVRLEDVDAYVDTTSMQTLVNYLSSQKIAFGIATIPHYMDPNGVYNGGVAESIAFSQATQLQTALNYALPKGGRILMHGYTHQYDNVKNAIDAVSADDYELWNIVTNTPVTEDTSSAYASGRLSSGLSELGTTTYKPFAWEAPHYQSSPNSILAVPPLFSKTYQRVVYYTSNNPNLNTTGPTQDYAVGQIFPYIINKDYYGQYVIPENLGNVEYNISTLDPSSNLTYTAQDILTNAQYAMVVRDGFASFFFHPFWLETGIAPYLPAGANPLADFESIITGISGMTSSTGLKYTWADPSTVQ
ncbi:MAG: DUF2334 domain-containing protein [Rhodomicrobium sp.]